MCGSNFLLGDARFPQGFCPVLTRDCSVLNLSVFFFSHKKKQQLLQDPYFQKKVM